jgi:hypothetical protein
MCYDSWLRRQREADESRSLWQDFERTRPVADREPAPEDVPPEPAEAQAETTLPER